jgi:hypothetical protein
MTPKTGTSMTTPPSPPQPPSATVVWQNEKHLQSGDRVWILSDVESYSSSYYPYSEPQELFKVGVYDLASEKIGFATFGRDIAYAMMRAKLPPPPWKQSMPFGIAVRRLLHDDGEEKGRYVVKVHQVPITSSLLSVVRVAKKKFAGTIHCANSTFGMWDDLVSRAAKENAIEAAALSMVGPFSAGDVRAKIGDPDAEVTYVLKRLVLEGKLLPPTGRKRGTRYQVAPPSIAARIDWTA